MASGTDVLSLPPWDVLPYDRVPPFASAVGHRVRTLLALTQPARACRSPAPSQGPVRERADRLRQPTRPHGSRNC
jgi:transcription-repair coupling factor (superfamily II helicase)